MTQSCRPSLYFGQVIEIPCRGCTIDETVNGSSLIMMQRKPSNWLSTVSPDSLNLNLCSAWCKITLSVYTDFSLRPLVEKATDTMTSSRGNHFDFIQNIQWHVLIFSQGELWLKWASAGYWCQKLHSSKRQPMTSEFYIKGGTDDGFLRQEFKADLAWSNSSQWEQYWR